MKLIPDSTTINSADSNMSLSLNIGILVILECIDRKQWQFSRNYTVLIQSNHFPAHKQLYLKPTLCQVGTYIPVGSYIKFQDLSGRYLNSSRFFNSGLRSMAQHLEQGKSEGFESCDRPIVQKRPIWVKIGDVLYRVTLKFDGWPWKTKGHLSFAVSSFVEHFIAIGEFKLELQSGNTQFGSNLTIFRAVWPWNLTDDLEK